MSDFFSIEHQSDKHIARDDEYSDSEDEGDDRRDESLAMHPERKRPRLSTRDTAEKEKESVLKPRIGNSFSPSPAPSGGSAISNIKEEEQRKGLSLEEARSRDLGRVKEMLSSGGRERNKEDKMDDCKKKGKL